MSDSPQIILRIESGPEAGEQFVIADSAFIGSGSNCDVHLPESGLEAIHARIGLRGSIFTLTDLTEETDVTVNGSRIKSRRLAFGDRIVIAGVEMSVHADTEIVSEDGSAQGNVVIVGIEDSPRTEITLMPPEDVDDYIEDDIPEPEETDAPAHEAVTQQRTISAMDERKLRHQHDAPVPGKSKAPVALAVVGALFLAGIGFFIVNVRTEKKKLADRYMEVTAFAENNRSDHQAVIARYKKFLDLLGYKHPDISQEVEARIAAVEAEVEALAGELQNVLAELDRKAASLLAEGRFDEAAELYRNKNVKRHAEVLPLRKAKLEKIAEMKAAKLARAAATEQTAAEERELIRRRHAREALERLADDVVELLLDGDAKTAIVRLEVAGGQETFAESQTAINSTLAMSRVLEAKLKLLDAEERYGKFSTEDLEGLSPAACTILLMRTGDLLAARSTSKKIYGHLLEVPLKRRILDSGDILAAEKKMMVAFLIVWRRISGDTGKRIPKPEACITTLESRLPEMTPLQAEELMRGLVKCRAEHGFTEFARRYADIFDFAENHLAAGVPLAPGVEITKAESTGGSKGKAVVFDPGNGKVSQVQDQLCFVDSSADIEGMEGGVVGIFDLQQSFYAADGTMRPLGSLVDITALYPFSVLGMMQATFTLEGTSSKPQIGQSVILGTELKKGVQFIELLAGGTSGAVSEDFSSGVFPEAWKRRGGSELFVKNGKLGFRRDIGTSRSGASKDALRGEPGHFEYNVNIGDGDVLIEFDLERNSPAGLSVGIGDVAFVIGTDGRYSEGIYLQGGLAVSGELAGESFGKVEKIMIERVRGDVTIRVNDNILKCRMQEADVGSVRNKVRFWGLGSMTIDNFHLDSSSIGSLGTARVAGLSPKGKEVLVHAGGDESWKVVTAGQTIHFMQPGSQGDAVTVAQGTVKVKSGDVFVCSVEDGKSISGACLVTISGKLKSSESVGRVELGDPVKLKRAVSDAVVFAAADGTSAAGLKLDMPVRLPAQGSIYESSALLEHPVSGEVLAAVVAVGEKTEFRQVRDRVGCAPLKRDGNILSVKPLKAGSVVDVKGRDMKIARQYSSMNLKKGIWGSDVELWKLQDGRLAADVRKTGQCPVLVTSEDFLGNFQFDIDVMISSPGKDPVDTSRSWEKDLLVEVFSPANMAGVSFGIGGPDENAPGLWVGGRTLSALKEDNVLPGGNPFPDGVTVEVGDVWKRAMPPLDHGQEYRLRVRREGDVLVLYLSGKRIASVRYPGMTGDTRVLVGSPRRTISVGKVSIMDISSACTPRMKESPAGDFGYVLYARDGKVLVDADMVGAEPQMDVSFMSVSSISTGKETKAIVLKKVGSGTILEVGHRTAVVQLNGESEAVKRGTKVIAGEMPDSHVVTAEWLRDISKTL